jgi:hypothetical protein
MTVDIQAFSNKLAEIYSNIAKPVLDVMCVMCSGAGGPEADNSDYTTTSCRAMSEQRVWLC